MRKWAWVLAVILTWTIALTPSVSFTEDTATIRLAQVIYTMAGNGSEAEQLAIGSLVLNRLESAWYPNTLLGVLTQQQQFPCGTRYDSASLAAAHAVLGGKRTLPHDAVAWEKDGSSFQRDDADPCAQIGRYRFYTKELRTQLN